MKMITTIYILRLEAGRFYIGKSNNASVATRFLEHLKGNGSAWTKLYKPISIDRTIVGISDFQENKITKEYMSRYGIDKVRGGSYTEVVLSEAHKRSLEKDIWGEKTVCTNCGRTNHFVVECYARPDVCGHIEEEEEEEEDIDYEEEEEEETCYRCGRPGHYSTDCFAKHDIHGGIIN